MPTQDRPKQAPKPTKTYLFRLYPTSKQMRRLEEWLFLCCEVYDAALDERKSAYRMAGVSLSFRINAPNCPGAKRCVRNWSQCHRRCCKMWSDA